MFGGMALFSESPALPALLKKPKAANNTVQAAMRNRKDTKKSPNNT